MPLPKGDNRNRPQPGSILNTEPIRDSWAIDEIKQRLLTLPTQREYLLFVLGINSGWRVTDLLNTRWADLMAFNQTNRVWAKRETKTGKIRRVIANDSILEAIAKWQLTCQLTPPEPSQFVFVGQRGQICPATVTGWVKDWTKQISLQGRFGGRSLRQTWAYQQLQAGQSLTLIMKMLGHSSEEITLRYVGITELQQEEAYKGVCL